MTTKSTRSNAIYKNKRRGQPENLLEYLGKGLHLQDEMPCHEATKYIGCEQEPLAMSSCQRQNPNSG